jgi:hypothetical protein
MITIKVTGINEVQQQLGRMGKQVPFAFSRALNETAKRVQKATYDEMRKKFDRPTPYALRSIAITRSTKANLTAIVGLRTDAPGKGMAWDASMAHSFNGGQRRWRKFEAALNSIGILPGNMAAVPPSESSWAITLDQYGNVPRGLIVVLLSYFQAFGEQGYRANSTEKTRTRRAKFGRTESGYKTINGVVYFAVLPGRDKTRHFKQPGIYAKRGIYGVDVAPVLLFVRRPSYQRRIDLERIARDVVANDFNAIFNTELAAAVASAK